MAVITIGSVWADGDQLTPANLNAKWSGATFASGATDGVTTTLSGGAIIVKDGGVDTSQLADDAVTGAKIASGTITDDNLSTTQDWSSLSITLPTGAVSATAQIADGIVSFSKMTTGAVATQAEAEGETASKLIAADIAKHLPGVAKAYGCVTCDTSTPVLSAEYNATLDSETTSTRVISLTSPMVDADYTVVLADGYTAAGAVNLNVEIDSASQFTIHCQEATGVKVFFAVYGNLA